MKRYPTLRNVAPSRNWKRTRRDVLNRDPICRLCRFRLATEVEQIEPGGGHQPSNLRGVCWSCVRRVRRDQRVGQTVTEALSTVDDEASDTCGALVVTHGPTRAGARFTLHPGTAVAGRQPGVQVFLNDATVSRKHVEFSASPDSERVDLRDLGSLNGTYVNNQPVERATLSSGDEIRIGSFRLAFHAGAS